jgi:pseudomonalisin
LFRATLQPSDVVATFLPSQAQAQAVVDYLSHAGFTNISVSANRLLVSADRTANNAQAAFGTRLVKATDANGRAACTNIDETRVPAALADTVLSVSGLQTVSHPHAMIVAAALQARVDQGKPGGGVSGATLVGHNPATFPTIYGAGSTPTASTITVGIISDGDMTQPLKDLSQFTTTNNLPVVNTQVVTVGTPSTDTSVTPEWHLDSQDIVGMSGGVGTLMFYAANSLSNSALTVAYNKAASDNLAQVINVSLGKCETSAYKDGSMAADDQIFALGVAQGQTFSISTGDSASNECSKSPSGTTPSYPASSPCAVAVSGTSLSTGTSNRWVSETLWSKAGSSPSTVEPKPSWQTQAAVPRVTWPTWRSMSIRIPSSTAATPSTVAPASLHRCLPPPGPACSRRIRRWASPGRTCIPCPRPATTTSRPAAMVARRRQSAGTTPVDLAAAS